MTKIQNPRTCLLVEGGGMKCAYSAGVLDAFLDEGISFDLAIGVSAGVANLASFLAGQRDRNRRFYVKHSQDWRYFSMRSFIVTGSAFGLQYIYNDMSVTGGADALDTQAVHANPARLLFPATNARTGKADYFSDADMKPDDLTAVCATCALPVMCRPVRFQGKDYYDGGVADSLPIALAQKEGVEKTVVIFSKPNDFHMKPQPMRAVYTAGLVRFPKMIHALNTRHERYNLAVEKILSLREEGDALTFAPDAAIKVSTYSVDADTEQRLYENGYSDGLARAEEVRKFLKA